MTKRIAMLAILATSSVVVLSTAANGTEAQEQAFESCLTDKALALEPKGAEVDRILASAKLACQTEREGLTNSVAEEVAQKVRLAVIQQRSNARNLLRRG